MSYVPSVRSIREAILEQARQPAPDPIAIESLRSSAHACVRGMRRAIDRACDFAQRGLLSEAAGLVEDYPDLARQAQALMLLPASDPAIQRVWSTYIDNEPMPLPLPTADEVDALAGFSSTAESSRGPLDALRIAVLRGEPVSVRLRILRRIRASDPRNRMWLDQIEKVEQEWIKQIANLRSKSDASREELDDALAALEANEWIATVPRGLKEEIYQKVKPLRAEEALVRYARTAERIHDASARMDRSALLELESEWAAINQETGRMPSDELAESVASAFDWLTRMEREERAQAEFDGHVEYLEQLLQSGRPSVEIERQLAVLRDGARPAPEGLLDRAMHYIEAEQLRLRRRHRIVVFSTGLAACVLAVVGLVALQIHNRRQREDAEFASLRDAIAAKDVAKAYGIAQAIKASIADPDAGLQAAIAEAEKLQADRVARTEQIRKEIESLRKEIDGRVARPRLLAMKDELDKLLGDAEAAERSAIEDLLAQRMVRLEQVDASIERAADEALSAADAALAKWPATDEWSDEEQLDSARWKAYATALDKQTDALKEALAAAGDLEAVAVRVKVRMDLLGQRRVDAGKRLEALQAAIDALKPDALCRRLSSELDFVNRVEGVIKAHGAVLARRDLLGGFEASANLKQGLLAVEAWRSEFKPRLSAVLGPDFAVGSADEDARARALVVLQEFMGRHPSSPYRRALDPLIASLQPGAAVTKWSPQQFTDALLRARIGNIDEVPLKGGRRFYRRPVLVPNPSPNQLNPLNRALTTLGDLSTDPERLASILTVSAAEIDGKSRPNALSRIWDRAQLEFGEATAADVSRIALSVLTELLADKESDVLMRFRVVVEFTDAYLKSGHAPEVAAKELRGWRDRSRRNADKALLADWLRAGWEEPIAFREDRIQAELQLKSFPDVAQLVSASQEASRKAWAGMATASIVGVLTPRGPGDEPRRIHGLDSTGTFWILLGKGTEWNFVEISVEGGRLKSGAALPAGPVLVHRLQAEATR
jgi:hypothetical protein